MSSSGVVWHRSSHIRACPGEEGPSVTWDGFAEADNWLEGKPIQKWKDFFDENGYLVVEDILTPSEVETYRDIYDKMLRGEIDASRHRHDLGNHVARKQADKENVCQIMWPSLYVKSLDEGPFHRRSLKIAQLLLGPDLAFDFDMLLSKAPHTETSTPWHQDASYWPNMPDKRSVTCWCALDDADVDNGCMWFVPGSYKQPLREHRPVREGVHVLTCDVAENEGVPKPVSAGSCTFHHGYTLHHTRGNSTDRDRRVYITNYRPATMVKYERDAGFDHGKKGLDNLLAKTDAHKDDK